MRHCPRWKIRPSKFWLHACGSPRWGGPNGVALVLLARSKEADIEVIFTVLAENLEYTEVLGEFLVVPIDIPELATVVANTQLC